MSSRNYHTSERQARYIDDAAHRQYRNHRLPLGAGDPFYGWTRWPQIGLLVGLANGDFILAIALTWLIGRFPPSHDDAGSDL
jgi:hypothetical protein